MMNGSIAVFGTIILIMLGALAVAADGFVTDDTYVGVGVILDKAYTGGQTGVAPIVGGNGGIAVTHTSDKYLVFFEFEGEPHKCQVNEDFWMRVQAGEKCGVYSRRGKLFGLDWGLAPGGLQ